MGFGGSICNAVSGQGGGIGSVGYVSLGIYGNTFISSCAYTTVWVDVGSILDIFLDFIQDENHSIFVSTHIVEDLEKIADYITFIHKGRIILSEEKDTLLERFVILKGPKEGFAAFESSELIGYKENRFGAEAMAEAKVWRKKEAGAAGLIADPVRIQDIMLYYVKGERI